MIEGIGTDIIEIARIKASFERHGERFLDKILTLEEKRYCLKFKDPTPHLAGRFAAKEAIAKALGTGFGVELDFHDIEIIPAPSGQPLVQLSSTAAAFFKQPKLHLTISHCKAYAVAFAIASS